MTFQVGFIILLVDIWRKRTTSSGTSQGDVITWDFMKLWPRNKICPTWSRYWDKALLHDRPGHSHLLHLFNGLGIVFLRLCDGCVDALVVLLCDVIDSDHLGAVESNQNCQVDHVYTTVTYQNDGKPRQPHSAEARPCPDVDKC